MLMTRRPEKVESPQPGITGPIVGAWNWTGVGSALNLSC